MASRRFPLERWKFDIVSPRIPMNSNTNRRLPAICPNLCHMPGIFIQAWVCLVKLLIDLIAFQLHTLARSPFFLHWNGFYTRVWCCVPVICSSFSLSHEKGMRGFNAQLGNLHNKMDHPLISILKPDPADALARSGFFFVVERTALFEYRSRQCNRGFFPRYWRIRSAVPQ